MKNAIILGFAAVAAVAPAKRANAQEVVLDWNATSTPLNAYWGVSEVGWFFTPLESIWVSFLGTHFNDFGDDRDVLAEIRTAPGSLGGVTLASALFNSGGARTGIGGGFFDSFLLDAGTSYFLGFRNIEGLGINVTSTGTSGPNTWFYSYTTSGSYGSSMTSTLRPILTLEGSLVTITSTDTDDDQPVDDTSITDVTDDTQLSSNETVTPEPISMILLGTGLAGVGAMRRRRNRKTASQS